MITGQLGSGFILENRYRILGRLGKGGMGVVYLAEDLRLSGRRCAIKELSPAYLPQAERVGTVHAFQQEAQVLARLSHPGLAKVTDVFEQNGNWYLVMEYITGQSLEDLLAATSGGRLPLQQALNITYQLCDVLKYLHNHQPPIIFRDLKPSNVMLPTNGGIKLIDFGIARFFKPGQAKDTQAMGTPGYAAPEQYGKGQSDARTDIYGLGVLLHQMLTGYDPTVTPFRLPPAETVNPNVPTTVGLAIRKVTHQDPDHRYPSVEHFVRALFSESGTEKPIPAPLSQRTPRWLWAAVGGGGLTLAFIAGILIALNVTQGSSLPTPTYAARIDPTLTSQANTKAALSIEGTAVADASISSGPDTPTWTPHSKPSTHTPTTSSSSPVTASDTPTSPPTATDPPTPTPPPTATDTPTPSSTATPSPSPTPQCAVAMSGPFTGLWENYRGRLGCPQNSPQQIDTAEQPFENGHMFWRQDWDDAFVVYDGRGDIFSGSLLWRDDLWTEGMPTESCTDSPPPNLTRPIRGFGLLWCTELGASNAHIGWALEQERGFSNMWQDFDNGSIFVDSEGNNRGLAYIFLYKEGQFVRERYK